MLLKCNLCFFMHLILSGLQFLGQFKLLESKVLFIVCEHGFTAEARAFYHV